MAFSAEQLEREKGTLPFGWGRFRKAYDRLAEIGEPGESLLATGVALSPEYRQDGRYVPGTVFSIVHELRKTTNVLLACTDQRVIVLSTGVVGGAREHASIPYTGLAIVEQAKGHFVIGLPEGQVKIRGMARTQQPRVLDVLAERAQPGVEASA